VGFLEKILGLPEKKDNPPIIIPKNPDNKPKAEKGNGKDTHKPSLSLDEELEIAWEYVQKKLCCYELPYPQINDSGKTTTASIDMSNHQIIVSKVFPDYLAKRGVDYGTSLRALLMHEAGHYKRMPWDLKNLIMLLYTAQKECGEGSKKDLVANYFMDVCVNLDLILNEGEDSLRQIYKASEKKSKIDMLLSNLYDFKAGNLKSGKDFGSPPLPAELKPKLEELKKIKFTSRKRAYANMSRFASIVKDLLPDEEQEKNNYSSNRFDDFSLKAYDMKEIDRAMKEIAKEMAKPSNYRKIYKFVEDEKQRLDAQQVEESEELADDLKKGKKSGIKGMKSNPDNKGYDPIDALIKFYSTKAEAYEMTVEDKSVIGGGDSFKSEFKPWEIEDHYQSVDVFNSYGKFLPEISKSWKDSGTAGEKVTKATPDLLVMIDSSGSMPNPHYELSHAALGGICAARQYLKKGSQVAVVNFSDKTRVTGFSDDYKKIVEKMLHFQNGGTELHNWPVYEIISKHNKEVDILMVSDGFIYNYENVMKELSKRKNANRVTILEIVRSNILGGFSGGADNFKGGNINVYPIISEQDIPKVIVSDMKSNGVM
jgi:hypothetical protein